MLCECIGCEQMLEVPNLNYHLLNECDKKNQYRQCPRCKEPIETNYYDQHVDEESCNPAQPLSKANRCSLCHEDIKPGEEGWKKHLLIDTCPNNERHP